MNLRSLLTTSLALTLTAAAHAQTAYTVAVIGGSTTSAFGISRDGLKTAGYQGSTAFMTNNNTTPILLSAGQGFAISNFNEVVGVSHFASGDHATLWSGSTPYDLGTLGGSLSIANHINTSYGDTVGLSRLTGNTLTHAFRKPLYSGMQDLGSLINNGNSVAYGITEEGLVVGQSDTLVSIGLVQHACLWDTNNALRDLELGSPNSSYALSATHSYVPLYLNGITFTVRYTHAVGRFYTSATTSRARVWTTNNYSSSLTVQNLLPLVSNARDSVAIGINAAQTIVGFSDITSNGTPHACRWKNGAVVDLNSLMVGAPAGTVLARAQGISEDGKIVVQGTINGSPRSFLLTPQ